MLLPQHVLFDAHLYTENEEVLSLRYLKTHYLSRQQLLMYGLWAISFRTKRHIIAKLIHDQKVTLQDIRRDGYSWLDRAIKCNDVRTIRVLIRLGLTIQDLKFENYKSLVDVARSEQTNIMRLFLRLGVTIEDIRASDAFDYACGFGRLEIVRLFLRRGITDIRQSGLLWATKQGHAEIVKLLVRRGKLTSQDIQQNDNELLNWATVHGFEDIVKLYLKRTPDLPECVHMYLIRLAWQNEHEQIVKLLYQYRHKHLKRKRSLSLF